MNEMIHLTIDGKQVTVEKGTTILEAAATLGIDIPTLCYHPDLSLMGACRVCIVDVKDMGYYMTACSVQVWEGMIVETNSPEIRQARRDIVELLIDNHPMDCQTCERDGRCELQHLAYSLGVLTVVTPAHGAEMDDAVCIQCGQCINVCPTAAFLEQSSTEDVWQALNDPNRHVVVQTAPSIRAAIGEGFDLPPGTPATGKMITALRRLGFHAIFDTDLGADMTIVEEANEFLNRLESGGLLPMLTSCSPGWVNFLEKFYPNLIPHASTCRSPMMMMSVLTKTYYAEKMKLDPKTIYMVAVMPCVAKKYESRRKEHYLTEGVPYTDAVLTTRELIWMIKCYGIDFVHLPDGEFDAPLGIATGAGDIFGITGGVMEATLRTASEKLTGRPADKLDFTEVRSVEGLREAEVKIGDRTLSVAVANGLVNAKTVLDRVSSGEKQYHIVEIMACPGGCSGGGGQPYPPRGMKVLDPQLLKMRGRALYTIDAAKKLRRSHENPAVKMIYEEFLGRPGSPKAHELLHTHYAAKLPRGVK